VYLVSPLLEGHLTLWCDYSNIHSCSSTALLGSFWERLDPPASPGEHLRHWCETHTAPALGDRLVLLAEEEDSHHLINACFLFLSIFFVFFSIVPNAVKNWLFLLCHWSTYLSASAKKLSEQLWKQRKHVQKCRRETQDYFKKGCVPVTKLGGQKNHTLRDKVNVIKGSIPFMRDSNFLW